MFVCFFFLFKVYCYPKGLAFYVLLYLIRFKIFSAIRLFASTLKAYLYTMTSYQNIAYWVPLYTRAFSISTRVNRPTITLDFILAIEIVMISKCLIYYRVFDNHTVTRESSFVHISAMYSFARRTHNGIMGSPVRVMAFMTTNETYHWVSGIIKRKSFSPLNVACFLFR